MSRCDDTTFIHDLIFRDNISVPTIPALARTRRLLNHQGRHHITLVITGGLGLPAGFVKVLSLGAKGGRRKADPAARNPLG